DSDCADAIRLNESARGVCAPDQGTADDERANVGHLEMSSQDVASDMERDQRPLNVAGQIAAALGDQPEPAHRADLEELDGRRGHVRVTAIDCPQVAPDGHPPQVAGDDAANVD